MTWYSPAPITSTLLVAQGISASLAFQTDFQNPSGSGALYILEGVDWAAVRGAPAQWFASLILLPSGGNFFWDSQSIGEGNGVRWTWRGEMAISPGNGIRITANGGSVADVFAVAWGRVSPIF